MNLKEILEENKRLKIMLEEAEIKIKTLNKKINELLKSNATLEEKLKIKTIINIIPKSEKIKNFQVDETEEIIKKEKKSRKGEIHKKAFEQIDLEQYVTETKILKPGEEYCPICGEKLVEFSEDVKYVVNIVKQEFKVTKIIKKNFKCPNCNNKNGQIFYPLSNDLFGKSILTPSLASYIANMKFDLGIPYHHLAEYISSQIKIPLSKQNLAAYMERTAEILKPLYEKMKFDLIHNSVRIIHADETPLNIKKRPEIDKNRKKSYVLLFSSSFFGDQINIYDFSENRSSKNIGAVLKGYEGFLVCDDYSGYDTIAKENKNIILQRCWVHARRNFANIVKSIPKAQLKNSKAFEILNLIDKLFAFEAKYKKEKLIPSVIKESRIKDQGPILELIKSECNPKNYYEKTAIWQAANYVNSNWNELTNYLLDGHVEISNNIAERAIKPFVVQRKVFMASNSYNGAKITTILFSIIRTAKINFLDTQSYLEYVLNHITSPNMDIENLLPYSKNIKEKFMKKW